MRCSAAIFALLLFAGGASGAETGVDLSWRWDDAVARAAEDFHPRFEVGAPDGGRFVFSSGSRASRMRRLDARGAVVWKRVIGGLPTSAAAMVLDGETLYAALYY